MFKHVLFSVLIFVVSCKSLESIEEKPACPKGYECYTEILKNQSIKLLEDSIGKIYINTIENDAYHIIKYTYKNPGKPEIADDTYIETFYFEFPKDIKNLALKDKQLSKAKVLAQKSCFCPDAGFELINQGQLDIEKHKTTYQLKFEFKSKKTLRVKSIETQVNL